MAAVAPVAAGAVAAFAGVTAAVWSVQKNWGELSQTFTVVGGLMKAQINLFVADCNLLAVKGRIAFTNFANSAKEKVNEGITAAKTTIQNGMSAAQSAINTFGNSARNTMQTTWSNISSRVSGAMTTIKSGISSGFNAAQSAATSAMNGLKSSVSGIWSGIQSNTSTVVGSIKNNTTELWNTLQSNISSAMSTAKNNVATAWTNIQNATGDARTAVKNALSEMTNKVQDFGGSVWTNLKNNVSSAWSGITSTINTALTNIKNAVSNTTLKFGKVTIPTFSWSGSNNSEKGTTANIKVESKTVNYASAMFGGAILKGATIFGAMGDKLLQAGEVGSEVVVGTNSLMNMIARTQRVNSNNQAVVAGISAIYSLLLEYLPESARQQQIVLDTGKLVGALTPSLNRQFGMMIRG
jgi:phage-related protein